ncbi:hypothetical protein R1flu_022274 [Riccia fluitans]|uniref:Uncharacterized protein n=1 Tax=Riccia fluitans TaxID=41844 RepID=A0ABD1ZSW7_9MARC
MAQEKVCYCRLETTAPGYGGVPKLEESKFLQEAIDSDKTGFKDLLVRPVAGCAAAVDTEVGPAATVGITASTDGASLESSDRRRMPWTSGTHTAYQWKRRHVQNVLKLYFTIGDCLSRKALRKWVNKATSSGSYPGRGAPKSASIPYEAVSGKESSE